MARLAKEREGLLPTRNKMVNDKYFTEDKLQREFEFENVAAHIEYSTNYSTQWAETVDGNGAVIYSDKEAS
jgi:hypothetical protein